MGEESDAMRLIEQFKQKIKEKSYVHQILLDYLGISFDNIDPLIKKEEKFEEFYNILREKLILTNKCEFREFLETIAHLWTVQSKKEIKIRIENLILNMKKDISNIFSETEIFNIFRVCKNIFISQILVEQSILSLETIIKSVNLVRYNDWMIVKFFYPEIRKHNAKYLDELIKNDNGHGLQKFVKDNDQNLDLFNEKRKEDKESKIIELIREDKIEEFISYVEHHQIDLKVRIPKEETIFETSTTKLTLIEFSALFGSQAIFKYLYMKEVDINAIAIKYNKSIIEYAIQGRNYEIIHLLEQRKDNIADLNNYKQQKKYLEESIKMHHNEIFDYLITNYNILITKEIINLIIIYQNYQLFHHLIERTQIEFNNKEIITNIFNDFCQIGSGEIVKILINHPIIDINLKDKIFHHSFEMLKIY